MSRTFRVVLFALGMTLAINAVTLPDPIGRAIAIALGIGVACAGVFADERRQ